MAAQNPDKNLNESPSKGEHLLPNNEEGLRYDEQDNLGLDADRSSDNQTLSRRYNTDNDVISHNPDGEDDWRNADEERGSSPLMDK